MVSCMLACILLIIFLTIFIIIIISLIKKGIELEKQDGRGIQFQNSSPYAFGNGILFLVFAGAIILEIYVIFKVVVIMLG